MNYASGLLWLMVNPATDQTGGRKRSGLGTLTEAPVQLSRRKQDPRTPGLTTMG